MRTNPNREAIRRNRMENETVGTTGLERGGSSSKPFKRNSTRKQTNSVPVRSENKHRKHENDLNREERQWTSIRTKRSQEEAQESLVPAAEQQKKFKRKTTKSEPVLTANAEKTSSNDSTKQGVHTVMLGEPTTNKHKKSQLRGKVGIMQLKTKQQRKPKLFLTKEKKKQ